MEDAIMLTQSEHIDQLAAALADVQALIDGVLKESPNAVYGSRYAELSKVWEAFQRVGPDHGLSVVQLPGHFDGEARTMSMSVRLLHSSGQWLGGEMSMPLSRADAHAYGSACTYARRYSLAALVGICPQDDDGNAASGVDPVSRHATIAPYISKRPPAHVHGLRFVKASPLKKSDDAPGQNPQNIPDADGSKTSQLPEDPQQLGELQSLLEASGVQAEALCRHYRVPQLVDLSPRDAARARRALLKKIDAKAASNTVEEAC
jgi:hypothetical protein